MGAAPLGQAYLASCLQQEGHKIRIVDTALFKGHDLRGDISQTIAEFPPDLVGVTIRNAVVKRSASRHLEWWVPGLGVNLAETGMVGLFQAQSERYGDLNVKIMCW